MGVPKFFRYISERYPCLSELAREQAIPDFDNLYLDMNGIIHNCSHPDDGNIHFNITEENMFKDIFNYIEKLFYLIKPLKLFFMAVDGVAPRAKMNQQRSRRFRSAKEAEVLEAAALKRGEKREHERFDSNCITPGTEFMARLHEALKYFIKSKISSDPLWQKCRIILSGHDCPGEGEHKIMDYIRYLKSKNNYDPNTRHCLYGLDADLIILGMCTHELHFVVLREEVKFNKKAKRTSVEETRFFLLHLGLLREYLEMEFDELKDIDDNFDIAKLIDDWVLMGFLVGNDFIPHLPCLHISSNALPLLYKTYIKVYPELGGNINESGILNLERLEKYFAALAEVEYDIFQENHADLKYFEAKLSANGIDEAFDFNVEEINNANVDNDLADMIESSRQFLEDDEESMDEEQHLADEFETYKRNYYLNKLQQTMSTEQKREQAICYITALQWVLDYYYRGVQSWDWYYPHHYAPFISDLKNFKDYKIKFNMGKPFLPFEQLLAVLPAASKELLPPAYRALMTDDQSAVFHFYPNDFKTDLNGKKHEWEAVVLIPFIDEKLLLKAMKDCEKNLTASERSRNRHGPMLQYDYSERSQGTAEGFYCFKKLYNVFCTEKKVWAKEIVISTSKTVCVELPNAARHVFFPGFPTMKHLDYEFTLKHARVKVFDQPSRNENMILQPLSRKDYDNIALVAEKFLGQIVYVGWPHLIKAKVFAVSNEEKYIDSQGTKEQNRKIFSLHVATAREHLSTRMGIEFEDFSVMLHTNVHAGSMITCNRDGKVARVDNWSSLETVYPAQGVVSEISVQKVKECEIKSIEEMFPVGSTAFFIGQMYYGCQGKVLNPRPPNGHNRVQLYLSSFPEPDFRDARLIQSEMELDYIDSNHAAMLVGISHKCLNRITGTVLVTPGHKRTELPENINRSNIGLMLKNAKGEERAGYSRRINNYWYYSSKAVELLQNYFDIFPAVFEFLSKQNDRGEIFETDIFGDVLEYNLKTVVAWLSTQEHLKAEKILCGSKAMEKEAVEKVLEAVEDMKTMPRKDVKVQVRPDYLLKPDYTLPNIGRRQNPRLFDRVVVVKTTYMVPIGSKGTVVGIYPVTDPNPVRLECLKVVDNFLEVLFDEDIPNANDIYGLAPQRVYRVPESAVLLIYTSERKNNDVEQEELSQLTANRNQVPIQKEQPRRPQEQRDLRQQPVKPLRRSIPPRETTVTNKISDQNSHSDFWNPRPTSSTKPSKPMVNMAPTNNVSIKQRPNQPIPTSTTTRLSFDKKALEGTLRLKNLLGILNANMEDKDSKPTTSSNAKEPLGFKQLQPTTSANAKEPLGFKQLQPTTSANAKEPLGFKQLQPTTSADAKEPLGFKQLQPTTSANAKEPLGFKQLQPTTGANAKEPLGFKQLLQPPPPPPRWMNDAKAASQDLKQSQVEQTQHNQSPRTARPKLQTQPTVTQPQPQPQAPPPIQSMHLQSPIVNTQQMAFGFMPSPGPTMANSFSHGPLPCVRPPNGPLVSGLYVPPPPSMNMVHHYVGQQPTYMQQPPPMPAYNHFYTPPSPSTSQKSQKGNFSADSLQQKGAFIPMQVLRAKQVKQEAPEKQSQSPIKREGAIKEELRTQAQERKVAKKFQQRQPKAQHQQKPVNGSEVIKLEQNMSQIDINATSPQSTTNEPTTDTPPSTTKAAVTNDNKDTSSAGKGKKKPPRTPKIGAKFDFA